jgi:hypothetical protein
VGIALRALRLVQPILAAELLFVFGYLSIAGTRRVSRRDWLAAAAVPAGIGAFLRLASPSGGQPHAAGSSWLLAGTGGVRTECGMGRATRKEIPELLDLHRQIIAAG